MLHILVTTYEPLIAGFANTNERLLIIFDNLVRAVRESQLNFWKLDHDGRSLKNFKDAGRKKTNCNQIKLVKCSMV